LAVKKSFAPQFEMRHGISIGIDLGIPIISYFTLQLFIVTCKSMLIGYSNTIQLKKMLIIGVYI